MQAAAKRLPAPTGQRRGPPPGAQAALCDGGRCGAARRACRSPPRSSPGSTTAASACSPIIRDFSETVAQSTCSALEWDHADCLKAGPIAELLTNFFAGTDPVGELDFRDGEGVAARYFRIKLAPLAARQGRGPRCLLSVVDRTVEVQAERTLRAEMLRDSLTGLPNRLAFAEAIEKAGDKVSRDLEHAVLVVDMLRFSRINESMGSLAGDELLITFARRLILALRGGDVLARTGGNEFGILVSLRRGVEDALKAAERIQEVMATPFKLSDLEIRIECAIGVALMDARQDPEELFRNAQFAVKQAKQAGKPQVYEPKEASLARRRFSIETELRRALEKDQLQAVLPAADRPEIGRSRRLRGAGALDPRGARRDQPDRVYPGRRGKRADPDARPLGDGQARPRRWPSGTARPARSCPSTSRSICRRSRSRATTLPAIVASALKSSGLTGDRLTLELTESSIVQDPARATRVFDALEGARLRPWRWTISAPVTRASPISSGCRSTSSRSTAALCPE